MDNVFEIFPFTLIFFVFILLRINEIIMVLYKSVSLNLNRSYNNFNDAFIFLLPDPYKIQLAHCTLFMLYIGENARGSVLESNGF